MLLVLHTYLFLSDDVRCVNSSDEHKPISAKISSEIRSFDGEEKKQKEERRNERRKSKEKKYAYPSSPDWWAIGPARVLIGRRAAFSSSPRLSPTDD